MNDFLSFQNRYFVTAELVMEQPLHIGKGVSLEPVGTDLPVIKTVEGLSFIPGSSVKGIIRSELEKLLRTLESQKVMVDNKKVWACNIFDEKEKCIPQRARADSNRKSKDELEEESKGEDGKINEEKFTQKILEHSCTACSLFGSTEIASRTYVKDMTLINGTGLRTEIRDGVAIDRDTGTAREGAKFDYEVVPAKARFKFEAVLENVELWEVGLFGVILKLWAHGEIAIGGMTSRGLGWGRLEHIELEKVDRADLIEYILNEKKQHVTLEDCIKEFQKKLVKGGEDA
jgi:CRISPR-associated protein Csm3